MLKLIHSNNSSVITIIFILLITSSQAQSINKTSYFKTHWNIGASVGTSLFFGDIKQYKIAPVSNYNNEWRGAASLLLGVQPSPVIGVRGQFLIGQLAGTRREWTTYFTSNYFDLTLNATISLRYLFSKYKPDHVWNVYILMGVGIINYNTVVKDLQTNEIIRKVGYGNGSGIGGSTMEGILCGGLGLGFRVSNNLNITIETSNRIMNSDMLDGRESGFKYDVYNYTSLGLTYRFGTKNKQKSEDYSFFNSGNNKPSAQQQNKNETNYDYSIDNPIETPEVDLLVIENVKPVEPPKTEKEVVVIKEVVETPQIKQEINNTVISEIEYRVQIRAKYGNRISIQYLSNKYNIPISEIFENTHNGFYIYTVGSFSTYEQARNCRNNIRTKNDIPDAFVVAFKNGKRLNKLP